MWALSRAAGEHAIWHKLSVSEALNFSIISDLAIPLLGRCRLTVRSTGTEFRHAHSLLIPTAEQELSALLITAD